MTVAATPTHYYVWYTVEGDRAAARRAIEAMMRAIEQRTGIAGRVLARRDDAATWMEIYEHVDDDASFERALRAAADEHGAARIAVGGQRHVERFAALHDVADVAR
jgi:Domain of unknown function (DUF4936)